MADRPLSERIAEILRLPIPGGSADTLAEAVELARRVEQAPVDSAFLHPLHGTMVKAPFALCGKRVALVEVPSP